MAKIYQDEIDAFLSSGTLDTLTVDSSEGNSINEALLDFNDRSRFQLEGNNWDKYRTKLAAFNEAMQTRARLAKAIEAAIKEALQLLEDYLGDDLMLDSSKLDEYKQERQNCKDSIDKLNGMLNATTQVEYTNENGEKKKKTVALYDAGEIRSQIALAEETIAELDRLITKIEGFEPVYQQAVSILEGAFSELGTFQSQVSAIVPDATFSYKPAA
ncbi:MAG: hypothetical protein J6X28_05200 [Bacilli bacterium]|nr:hypothetical protein [Bacilli bacterium]